MIFLPAILDRQVQVFSQLLLRLFRKLYGPVIPHPFWSRNSIRKY